MPEQPWVDIVLLNWNRWRDTLDCIGSLMKQNYGNFRIIVVDNGSNDDSVDRIRSAYPNVTLIVNQKNLGFGGGCNRGAHFALEHHADYVWFLNNDTTVDADALARMVWTSQSDPEIGAVGAVLYYADKPEKVQAFGGGYIHMIAGVSRHFTNKIADESLDYLTGASLLIPQTVLQQVGLFDERFFMYWEDTDLCYRIRQAGYRLAVAKEAIIWHKESASLGKKSAMLDRYFNQSAVYFLRKHAQFSWLPILIGVGGRFLKRILSGDFQRAYAVYHGFWDGLRNMGRRA